VPNGETRTAANAPLLTTYFDSCAGILAITAVLKALSILGESEQLAIRDHVVRLLTLRQMLALASVVELAVAWFVVTSPSRRAALCSLAWLSSVLLTYRFALSAVKPGASCGCLGVIATWLPGRASSLDLASRVLLGYLLAPTLVFLAWDGTAAVLRSRFPRAFRRRSAVYHLLVLPLCGFCISASAAYPPVSFQAEGDISWEGTLMGGEVRASRFVIEVSGAQWYLRLTPTRWSPRSAFGGVIPNPLRYEISSDGTNTYEMRTFDATNPFPAQVAERWPGSSLMNRAVYHEAYALWYALASHAYLLAQPSDRGLPPLEPGGALQVRGTVRTNGLFPWLPEIVACVAAEPGLTNTCELRALTFTNVFELCLPLHVESRYAWADRPLCAVRADVKRFEAVGRSSFALALNDRQSTVYDSTFICSNPPFTARLATNNWPSVEEVGAIYRRHAGRALTVGHTSGKRQPVATALLICVASAGPLAFLVNRFRKLRNVQRKSI
jgi:hypothetical protein